MRWWLLITFPAVLGFSGWSPPQESNTGYVGREACQPCHSSIYETYRKVSMSRTFDRIELAPPIESWTTNNRFYHEASDQHFVMSRRDGKYFQQRYRLDADGNQVDSLEREIHFTIGSANQERDYFNLSEAGELTQFPIVWYSGEEAWGIAPGYDWPEHHEFSRRVNYRCVFCHNAYPSLPEGADRYDASLSLFPKDLPLGVDCERCHGPGEAHVRLASAGGSASQVQASVVNPARLTRQAQLDVCLQCHLATTVAPTPGSVLKTGRDVFSYRPGEPLTDYAVYFDYPSDTGHDDDFNLVHQGYRLAKSQCFLNSSMTCTTCHNPHQVPDNKKAFYNDKCMTCHDLNTCKLEPEARSTNGDDCVACHMPKRRTQDIVHVVLTDHNIQRRPGQNLLEPLEERHDRKYDGELDFYFTEQQDDLHLGLALVRGADVGRGVGLLNQAISNEEPTSAEPYFYLASGLVTLGRKEQAITNYEKALELDPAHAEARYNLGIILLNEGRLVEAIEAFELALGQQPAFADAHVAAGSAKSRLGRLDEAVAHYRNAVAIDPLHTVALNNLGLIEMQVGDKDRAQDYFRQVLGIRPDDATARDSLEKMRSAPDPK